MTSGTPRSRHSAATADTGSTLPYTFETCVHTAASAPCRRAHAKPSSSPLRRKRRCVGRFNLRPERSKRPRDGIVLHAGQHNAPARPDKAAQGNIQTVRRVHGENDLLRRGVEQLRRLGAAGIDDPRRRVCRRMAAAPTLAQARIVRCTAA